MLVAESTKSPSGVSTSVSVMGTCRTWLESSFRVRSEMAPMVGASLTGVTVMLTVATLLSAWPSLALYWKLSVPLKLAAGV